MHMQSHAGGVDINDVLDMDLIYSLTDGDPEFIAELVETFVETVPEQMGSVREAIDSGDPHEVHRAGHRLKGSVGNFTTKGAYVAARAVEMCGRNNEMGGVEDAYRHLVHQISLLQKALEQLVANG